MGCAGMFVLRLDCLPQPAAFAILCGMCAATERNTTPKGVAMSTPKEETIKTVFSARIRSLIGSESVSAFARRVGLKQAAIDRYVKGVRAPAAEALVALANSCSVSSDWLLGLSSTPAGEKNSDWRTKAIAAQRKLDKVNEALGKVIEGTKALQEAVK